jgi:hypothetical protein
LFRGLGGLGGVKLNNTVTASSGVIVEKLSILAFVML